MLDLATPDNVKSATTDPHRPKDFLDPTEIKSFFDAAKAGRQGIRDHLLFLMMYRHGLRCSEDITRIAPRHTVMPRRERPRWRRSLGAGGENKRKPRRDPPRKRLTETWAHCAARQSVAGLSGRDLPDVLPCKGKYDHCHNRQQAQLSPQIVD